MCVLPVLPHGLHLLRVVGHVALQSDALWCALEHQLRGRGAWEEHPHTPPVTSSMTTDPSLWRDDSKAFRSRSTSDQYQVLPAILAMALMMSSNTVKKKESDKITNYIISIRIDQSSAGCLRPRQGRPDLAGFTVTSHENSNGLIREDLPCPEISNREVSFPLSSVKAAL